MPIIKCAIIKTHGKGGTLMPEIVQLKQLIAIYNNKTLSKAANELHISQPALSRSMQKLEDELGVELFDHYTNKIELNKNGEIAVKHAKKILRDLEYMINEIHLTDQANKIINIACCTPAPLWDIEPLIKKIYPLIPTQIQVIDQDILLKELRNKKYQLIITPFEVHDPNLICIPYIEEDLMLSLPPNHPLTNKEVIHFKDLDGETMLLYSNIGFWRSIHETRTPHTRYLLQNERSTFNEILKASNFPYYTTNLTLKREGPIHNRVVIPIDEEEAHVTYFIVLLKENKKHYLELLNKIENYYDY